MCTSPIEMLRGWNCPEERSQRDAMLEAWAELMAESTTTAASVPDRADEPRSTLHDPSLSTLAPGNSAQPD